MNEDQTEMTLERQPDPRQMPLADHELPEVVFTVIGYLSRYARGAENAQTSEAIGAFVNKPSREVRNLISIHLDKFPFVVCGSPGGGFFVTDDPEALEHYEAYLHSLLKSMAMRISSFRRLATRCGFVRQGTGKQTRYRRK